MKASISFIHDGEDGGLFFQVYLRKAGVMFDDASAVAHQIRVFDGLSRGRNGSEAIAFQRLARGSISFPGRFGQFFDQKRHGWTKRLCNICHRPIGVFHDIMEQCRCLHDVSSVMIAHEHHNFDGVHDVWLASVLAALPDLGMSCRSKQQCAID